MMKQVIGILILTSGLCMAQMGGDEGSLSGEVKNLKGQPIEGVTIELVHTEDARKNTTMTSSKKGRFSARGMVNGVVILKASKEGYISREYRYKQGQTRQRVSFAMVSVSDTADTIGKQANITGTVTDTSGNPLADVELEFTSPDLPFYKKTVKTNAKGKFETSGIELMKIKIVGRKEGYAPYAYEFQQGDAEYKVKKFEMATLEEAGGGGEKNSAIRLYNEAAGPYQARDFEEAERLAKQAIEIDPEMSEALKLIIYSNAELKDWEDVLNYAEQYMKLNPSDEDMRVYALDAARMSGNTEKLNEMKAEMKRTGTLSPDLLYTEAITHINNSNDTEAAKLLQEIIGMDPNHAMAYYYLGKIKTREYEFEDAIKYFKKHLEVDPGSKYKAEVQDLISTLAE